MEILPKENLVRAKTAPTAISSVKAGVSRVHLFGLSSRLLMPYWQTTGPRESRGEH